jgi:hypothetical protein
MKVFINKLILSIAGVSALAASSIAFAADQAGNANVEIVSAITISEDTQVDFGQIINANGTGSMASGGSLSGTTGKG